MAELDGYRKQLAAMGLGDLVQELVTLKMTEAPEAPKALILHVQKQREVVLQLNKREVLENGKVIESRDTKVRSLKNIF